MAHPPSGPTLWLALMRTFEAMNGLARATMRDAGLGPSEFMLLEPLLHLGPQTPTALGSKVGLTSGSITAALDRLEQRGLLARRSNPVDQRSCIVELTSAGRELIAPAYERHAAELEHLVGGALTADQRTQLFGLLGLLRKAAREEAR